MAWSISRSSYPQGSQPGPMRPVAGPYHLEGDGELAHRRGLRERSAELRSHGYRVATIKNGPRSTSLRISGDGEVWFEEYALHI